MFSKRHQSAADAAQKARQVPARLIMFPAEGASQRQLVEWLKHTGYVRNLERTRNFVVVVFSRYIPTDRLIEIINSPLVGYSEPDCDGPDYLTTSMELPSAAVSTSRCWLRAARSTFPNDPCLDELWGHRKIGWDSGIAARSLPRIVAVLDSGIDAAH
ncbi:MAG TPA: hypothetical protein VEW08_15680, partial [Steroidobacteraceae bacterium]|nr:hypothetical protein [Steroidobacteraceae bacterium]